MDDKPTNPGSDAAKDEDLINAARQQAEGWSPPSSETETTPAAEGGDVPVRFRDLPADSFPGYEIIKEAHRGGQGVVYQAVQKATKRRVAIKVMHEGPFAGPRDKARFEREVQILAALKHPNIVTIHDSGTAAGHFFYVMDYISGLPLDQYMASGERSIDETLKLFGKICDAVNAAHLKGVIHRDLKPGNIRIDSKGEPHVLDFGLAKVAMGDTTGDSRPAVMSMTGQFIGSLPWASPEQAEAVPDKIDIRTDVYSLGVILYQMLTGKFPYEVVGNMRDVLDRILKAEPTKPSTIRRQINDEVETIVLKCLQKERERRYQSAGELARDVGHYLLGEPIEAKRDSFGYMLRKQLRYHRTPVAVATSFMILIVVFAGVMSILAERNRRLAYSEMQSKEVAIAARDEARKAQESEVQQRAQAEHERDAAQAARDEADKLRLEAEWKSYLANINAAEAALRVGEIAAVRRRLAAPPAVLRNWEWSYLNARSDWSLATLVGHNYPVSSLAFSPDGTCLASGSGDGIVVFWDGSTGTMMGTHRAHAFPVYSLAFSPDGTRLASSSELGPVTLWDAASRSWGATLRGHSIAVVSVAFSPDGTHLATGSRDKTVKVWDVKTAAEVATLRGHDNEVHCVAFAQDGLHLASGSLDKTVRLWDATSGMELATFQGHEGGVSALAFSPDGSYLASGSDDRTVRLWDPYSVAERATLRGHESQLTCLAINPDGTRVASASDDKTVRLWDAASGAELATFRGHEGPVSAVVFSPDGAYVASGSRDKTVRFWDATTGPVAATLSGGDDRVKSMAFDLDAVRVAVSLKDKTVRVWDVTHWTELATLRGHAGPVSCTSFSLDGKYVASASSDNTVRVWNAESGLEVATLRGHTNPVYCVAFSSSGRRVASGSHDKTVRLWDTTTRTMVATFQGHNHSVLCLAFSEDEAWVVSGSEDRTVKIWNVLSGAEKSTFRGHESSVCSVAFSPDGKRVASGSYDGSVRIWDTASQFEAATLRGHEGPVMSVAFNSDGTRIASASQDKTVKIWDAASGEEIVTLRGHEDWVVSVVFSPDGTRLVSGALDGAVKVWDSVSASARAAMPAQPLVDGLFEQLRSPEQVFQRLREDVSLCPAMRSAAAAAILNRTTQLSAMVNPLVDRLFAELKLAADVTARLRHDTSLSEPVREFAIDLVQRRGDDPELLNDASWFVLKAPGKDAQAYRQALRWAEAGCKLAPENGLFMNTLGVAKYRVGAFQDALAMLTRSDELNSASDQFRGGDPADVAFIAMSLHKLRRFEEARMVFDRLRKLMAQQQWSQDQESQGFLREAEALILGTPTIQAATATEPGEERPDGG